MQSVKVYWNLQSYYSGLPLRAGNVLQILQ